MKDYSFPSSSSRPAKSPPVYWGLVLLGMGIGIGGTFLVTNPQVVRQWTAHASLPMLFEQSKPTNVAALSESKAPISTLPEPSNFVVDVVKETGPAVVRINAARKVKAEVPSTFNSPFFQDFFGSAIPQPSQEQIQRGTGSGFVVGENGRILTNAHVVAGADEVTVTLKDGRTLPGRVLGADPMTDVAVVKVEAEHLPVAKVGDSDQLQVGEWAIAIGNPLGLDNTVTTGIISATGRNSSDIGVGDKRVQFIQTDAAINPGNSGGPLLNANGEVIGMNTAIIQNAQGIGFAIPINQAERIAEQLIATGKVEHPYLGIQMAPITPELQEQLKARQGMTLPVDQGIVIVGVVPNSPAAQAGLRAGDVLTSLQGQKATSPEAVQNLVAKVSIGTELPLTVLRDNQNLELNVRVGTLPAKANS
ncbi:HhoA/HhoB/HtrA family serine endopeptidase [Synechocystis sp. LKSZ1]|uniref:HhoA/HhoB/HtrA family serine endopeptidase n=1 Tax=Synechocystis sp. LKSZ1 TaxID=3144951 RepID=UPI00336C1047